MIAIHVLRTRYPHWGGRSGINQLFRHLSPRCRVDERLVPDGDDDFPVDNPRVRAWWRERVQRDMPWYKLSDLVAETQALGRCWRGMADVIHYLDGEHSAQYVPRLPRIVRRGAKLLGTFHQPASLLGSLLAPDSIAGLDAVTVVAPEQVPFFAPLLPADRVHLIPHGIDTGYFRPGTPGAAGETLRCLTVGHYLRDFDALARVAEALREHRGIEFHVVSSAAAHRFVGLPNVTAHAGLGDDALLALYQRSDLLLLPLLESTANNALLEGIACGLPVVSTRLPSVEWYVPGDEAVLVERSDSRALAAAVVGLAGDRGARARMGCLARARAESLSWERIAPRYERVYAQLAGVAE